MTSTNVIITCLVLVVFLICFIVYEIKQMKKHSDERKKFIKLLSPKDGDLIEVSLKLLNVINSIVNHCGGQFSTAMIRGNLNREAKTTIFLSKHDIFLIEIFDYFIANEWIDCSALSRDFFVVTEKGEKVAKYSSSLLTGVKNETSSRRLARTSIHSE